MIVVDLEPLHRSTDSASRGQVRMPPSGISRSVFAGQDFKTRVAGSRLCMHVEGKAKGLDHNMTQKVFHNISATTENAKRVCITKCHGCP